MQCYFYDGNEKENNCFTFSPAEVGIVNYMSSIIKLNVDNMH